MSENMAPSSRVELRGFRGGRHFHYEPLGDDAVIRFNLADGEYVDVRIRGGTLHLHHVSQSGGRIAVQPEASNDVSIVLLPRED